jgi:hypothetical protein
VEEAEGWHLLEDQSKTWMENFVDEDTNEIVSMERSEVIVKKGCRLTAIDISTLKENGITGVRVSSIPLLGEKQERMNLWETILKVKTQRGEKKRTYIVTAESPTAAETFISGYLEINEPCTFESIKVNRLDYAKVIRMYETEQKEYEQDGKRSVRWYRSQIFATVEDGDEFGVETGSSPLKSILVQSTDLERALKAINSVMGRNEYDAVYKVFKLIQELNIVEVFVPDENVSYYSNEEVKL